MSALALMLAKKGEIVSGNDPQSNHATELLKQNGITVDKKINVEAIKNADVIVFSSAIKQSDKQIRLARQMHKKILSRGQLLGMIANEYEKVIAIAGSHGKTTTTAMIYEIAKIAGLNPTLHLGGFRVEDGKNYEIGDKNVFITEACEYFDNFLYLYPSISVVTNIEKEHLDYFGTFENQLKSFEKFKRQSQAVIEEDLSYKAKSVRHDKSGRLNFSLFHEKTRLLRLHLQVCENVNVKNCIYAYRVAKVIGISDQTIKLGLERFAGVKTRFERVKCNKFEVVVCDYAHHPTEIKNSIESVQKIYKGRNLVVIFQPHTFSRTKLLLDDFVKTLKGVNSIIYKTYSAREKEEDGISAMGLSEILKKNGAQTCCAQNFEQLMAQLNNFDKKDVLLFVGAGDLPSVLHKKKFIT